MLFNSYSIVIIDVMCFYIYMSANIMCLLCPFEKISAKAGKKGGWNHR